MAELFICGEREDLGGGHFRHTQHIKPICYADAADAGRLKRIVSNWVDSGIIGRPHLVSASRMMVSVAGDGMRRIHPTREADRYMEIGTPYVKIAGVWRKVGFTGATRTANSITWHRAEANLTITHAGHFIKLDLELLDGYVPEGNLVAFPVGLSGLTRSGTRILAGAETVALLRAPVVTDAANVNDVRPIAWEFANVGGQPYLVMTLPSLAGMMRPVVDPTLTLQPDAAAGKDTEVNEAAPDTSYATATTIMVYWTGAANHRHGMIYWDLSALPPGAGLISAIMTIYTSAAFSTKTMNGNAVLAANAEWSEACTWNYADGAGASDRWAGDVGADGGTDAGCSVSGTDFNAAAMGSWSFVNGEPRGTPHSSALTLERVMEWMAGQNYGMYLRGVFGHYVFCSSDHATADYRPKLVVEYTLSATGGRPIYHQFRR